MSRSVADLVSHPVLPITVSCSFTGNCLLIDSSTITHGSRIATCVHLQREALDRVKFSKEGRLFGVASFQIGRLFLLQLCIVSNESKKHMRVASWLQLERKVSYQFLEIFSRLFFTDTCLDDRFSDLRNGRRSFREGIVSRWKRKIKRSSCRKRDYRVFVSIIRPRSLRRERGSFDQASLFLRTHSPRKRIESRDNRNPVSHQTIASNRIEGKNNLF